MFLFCSSSESFRIAFVNFLFALGYLALSCSCFASWFGGIGHFLGVVFLPVILFKVFQALSDECVKSLLVIVSIHVCCLFVVTPPLLRDGGTARTAIQVHAVNLIEIRLEEIWQPISNQS